MSAAEISSVNYRPGNDMETGVSVYARENQLSSQQTADVLHLAKTTKLSPPRAHSLLVANNWNSEAALRNFRHSLVERGGGAIVAPQALHISSPSTRAPRREQILQLSKYRNVVNVGTRPFRFHLRPAISIFVESVKHLRSATSLHAVEVRIDGRAGFRSGWHDGAPEPIFKTTFEFDQFHAERSWIRVNVWERHTIREDKRVGDCMIGVSELVEVKEGVPSDFPCSIYYLKGWRQMEHRDGQGPQIRMEILMTSPRQQLSSGEQPEGIVEKGTQTRRAADSGSSRSSSTESEEVVVVRKSSRRKKSGKFRKRFEEIDSESSDSERRKPRKSAWGSSNEHFEIEKIVQPHPDTIVPHCAKAPPVSESFWTDNEFFTAPTPVRRDQPVDAFANVLLARRTPFISPPPTAVDSNRPELRPDGSKSTEGMKSSSSESPKISDAQAYAPSAKEQRASSSSRTSGPKTQFEGWDTKDDQEKHIVAPPFPDSGLRASSPAPNSEQSSQDWPPASTPPAASPTEMQKVTTEVSGRSSDWFQSVADPTASFFMEFENKAQDQSSVLKAPERSNEDWAWPDAAGSKMPWEKSEIITQKVSDSTTTPAEGALQKPTRLPKGGPIADLLSPTEEDTEPAAPPFPVPGEVTVQKEGWEGEWADDKFWSKDNLWTETPKI